MAGGTLADLIDHLVSDEAVQEHLSAFVGGDYVPPHYWDRVRPKAGSSVFLKVVPADPLTVLAVLAPIAGNFVAGAAVTAGLVAAGSLGASLIAAGVAFAILAIGQSLFGPSQPNQKRFEDKPTFSITGARNRATPYAPIPVVLGTHKHIPPYGAAPYTEIVNGQQYLRFVVVWGYGPVDVNNIKVGNTPIEDFEDVEVENDFEGASTALGLYPADVTQESLSIRLDTSYQTRTTDIATNEIGMTFTFPSGIVRFSKKSGSRLDLSVRIDIQFRKVGDVTWTEASYSETGDTEDGTPEFESTGATSYTLRRRARRRTYTVDQLDILALDAGSTLKTGFTTTDNSPEIIRVSYRIVGLELGQYEVRVKRGSTELQISEDRVRDRVDWTALRSFNTEGEPVRLAGIAKSAYRIKASDQLNGVIDQLNGIVSTKIPIWTGADWDEISTSYETVTSNPAAIYRWVLKGVANPVPVGDANIDDAGLGAWYDTCETEGYTYNAVIDFTRPIRDLLQDIANAGKASPAYLDDKWTVIEEKPRTTLVQHFSPRNYRNFNGVLVFPKIPHALRIRFANELRDYREDERTVYDDGFDSTNATEFEVIDLPGQTDPDNVYRLGRHYLASARLRPERFIFEVDVEHLVATRGDLCRLTSDAALIGQAAGRIKAIGGSTITLDGPVDLLGGTTYRLRVRDDAGDTNTFDFSISTSQTTDTLSVTPSGIAVGDLFVLGEQANESIEVLIAGIEYLDNLAARVECVPYSPEIYDSADAIPLYESNLSTLSSASFVGPPKPVVSNIVTDEEALFQTATGDLEPRILLYVEPGAKTEASDAAITQTQFLQARYQHSDTPEEPFKYSAVFDVDTDYIDLVGVETGRSYNVDVRAIGSVGETSSWVRLSEVTVLGALAAPPAIDTFGINTIGDHTYVEWEYTSIPIDVIGYEIRYHPNQDVTIWSQMTPLSDEVPREARAFTVPSRKGSYAIKAIDVLGNKSESARFVNASLEDPRDLNAILTLTEDPLWTGTKTDCVEVAGDIQLNSSGFIADWTTLADVSRMATAAGDEVFDPDTVGYYEFGETDLGTVQTSRVSVDMGVTVLSISDNIADWTTLASVNPIAGDATGDDVSTYLQVAYSLDDVASGETYSDWRRFVVGDYTARHLKFRLVLETVDGSQSPVVESLTVNIDMPDELRQGNDISSGAGTYSVVFSPAFQGLISVSIAAQDMQTGDYYEITSKTRTGFDITFRNSGGTAVSRTFDYLALGYGRERAT